MKKYFLYMLVAIVVTVPYAYFMGPQTWLWLMWTPSAEKAPELYAVPQPMAAEASCPAGSSRLRYFGWRFQAPWPKYQEGTVEPPTALIAFDVGVRITITGESDAEREARENPAPHEPGLIAKAANAIWGASLARVDTNSAEFREAIFAATPENVSLTMPRAEALGLLFLFPLKMLHLKGLPLPIQLYKGQRAQVFQFGAPGGVDPISLVAYGPKGNRLHLVIADSAATGGYFRQKDFDCIAKTLR